MIGHALGKGLANLYVSFIFWRYPILAHGSLTHVQSSDGGTNKYLSAAVIKKTGYQISGLSCMNNVLVGCLDMLVCYTVDPKVD